MNRNLMRIFKNGYLDFHSEQQGTEFAKKKGYTPCTDIPSKLEHITNQTSGIMTAKLEEQTM